jgi:hypothetical protein
MELNGFQLFQKWRVNISSIASFSSDLGGSNISIMPFFFFFFFSFFSAGGNCFYLKVFNALTEANNIGKCHVPIGMRSDFLMLKNISGVVRVDRQQKIIMWLSL